MTLVAGERCLPLYRHATPTGEQIGRQAMLVFCPRGYGLYTTLTRFVSFGNLSNENAKLHSYVREIEVLKTTGYTIPSLVLYVNSSVPMGSG